MMPYKSWIMPSVEDADWQITSISMDEYAVAYNAASTSNAKLLITMVFPDQHWFCRCSDEKNRYFGDHLSCHWRSIYNLL